MNNQLVPNCPDCGNELGSSEFTCKNCADYNDYMADEYYDKQNTEQWEKFLDHLWSLQDK
jgi:hypothetical protein